LLNARSRSGYAARVLALAGVYYGSAKLGLNLAFETKTVTAIWPPTGIALAALVLGGPRLWPGVALGALLANVDTGVSALTVGGITLGNTLEALTGTWLLVRVAGFDPSLRRIRDVLLLVALGAVVSTIVSATIGVLSLLAGGSIDIGDTPSLWRTWWLGDMGGDLVVAPALFVAATHWRLPRPPGRALEALALALAIAGTSAFVFTQDVGVTYVMFPLLVWAALRFWQAGAAGASLISGAIAVVLTSRGHGPYAMSDPDERLLLAQTFTGISGISGLLLAAVTSERHRAEGAVREIASTLEQSLLPVALPELPDIETATLFRAAGERQQVGGDFYDLFRAGDGSWVLAIGDVRGKGAGAAAMTALARHTLRAAALHERRPSRALELLNEAMLAQHGGRDFCTVAYASLDLEGEQPAVTLALAGHPNPLILRADGQVEDVGRPGVLLGLDADAGFYDQRVLLDAGDCLLLYTDGLTDAHAPDTTVSPAELRAALGASGGESAAAVLEALERQVLGSVRGEPRDDIAVVVLRFGQPRA
jgi:integral membrane sensor domain MASE1